MSNARAVDAWAPAGRAVDLKGDGPHSLFAGGVDLVAVRAGGVLKVYEGRCPHQGALLGEGELDGAQLVCRNHRWTFDAATGQRVGGAQCLKACPSREENGQLLVDVSSLAPTSERRAKATRRLRDLPGPRQSPIVGNALQLDLPRMHLQLERWAAEYGSLFQLRLVKRPVIVVSDTALGQAARRARPDSYRRSSNVELMFRELEIEGVFSAEDEAWRAQRRLAMSALAMSHLRDFYPMLQRVLGRLVKRWEKAADAGTVLDLADEMKLVTVDVMALLVFGHDADTLGLEAGEDVLQKELAVFFPALMRRLFAAVPYWRVVRLPADRRADRARDAVVAWVKQRIETSRKRLAEDPSVRENPTNFIESMLVARDAAGRPYTDKLIVGNAITMLIAGEDTTALSISWAIHHLIDEPRVRAALREEADRVFGDAAALPALESADLPYAAAVGNESLRLRAVAPVNILEPREDVVIGDVEVPKGAMVVLLTRLAMQEASSFADPLAFKPERWIPELRGDGAHDATKFVAFGGGPRICPGRALALLEMRTTLATIYRSFDIERVGQAKDVEEHLAFAMMARGLRVRVRRRTMRA